MVWLAMFSGVVVLFVLWRFFFFFRNPKRDVQRSADHIISPADGRVIYARRVENSKDAPILAVKGKNVIRLDELMHVDDDALLEKSGTLVGIFMSPFDVHYNRAPIDGTISKIAHDFPSPLLGARRKPENAGMFNGLSNLLWDERPYTRDCDYVTRNERASYVIKNSRFSVYVTQIAERWVKRIVTYKDNEPIRQGEVFGLIRMGSQVDLFVPDDAGFELRITERQRVKAGLTVLFERVM